MRSQKKKKNIKRKNISFFTSPLDRMRIFDVQFYNSKDYVYLERILLRYERKNQKVTFKLAFNCTKKYYCSYNINVIERTKRKTYYKIKSPYQ